MGTPLFTYTRLTSFVRYVVMPVAYAEQRGNYSSYTDYGVRRMPDGHPPCSLRSQTLTLLPYLHLSPHLGSASQHEMYTFCGINTWFPVSTGILPHSLPEWAFRARPGLWRNCLCPKVARIAEHKFGSRQGKVRSNILFPYN